MPIKQHINWASISILIIFLFLSLFKLFEAQFIVQFSSIHMRGLFVVKDKKILIITEKQLGFTQLKNFVFLCLKVTHKLLLLTERRSYMQ